eukprot:TRINITY_DN79259_c0_g1_i1.p1 TRINITY_DN79259_c0_g1~~TRINITY_DN79259_c0_g1_i1.p1  ORF type:complete len:298 (+),score=55.61 TRINITY_DN79259_c0_g1_i1:58-951(+)
MKFECCDCEFTWDVFVSGVAAVLSVAGAVNAVQGYQGQACCDGYGSNAAAVLSHVLYSSGTLMFVLLPFNLLCFWVLVLSFFHPRACPCLSLTWLTTSKWLRILQLIAQTSFFFILFFDQLLLIWLCCTTTLSHLCSNSALMAPAQMIALALGNSPAGVFSSFFGAQQEQPFYVADFRQMMQGVNIKSYCNGNADASTYLFHLWLASLLFVISQGLLAASLRGEKQRATMHELLDEMTSMGHVGGEVMQGLLGNSDVVQGAATALGGPLGGAVASMGLSALGKVDEAQHSSSKGWFS